jgi:hypothetical protein
MKKILLLFFLFTLTLSQSCASTRKIYYELTLEDVELPTKEKKQINVILPVTTDEQEYYEFEDNTIKIQWFVMYSNFGFKLWNKSTENIKIIWDEAAMIDTTGMSNRVMHGETKFIKSDETQVPTPVLKGGFIDDLVYPTDWSYYQASTYLGKGITIPGRWQTPPTFMYSFTTGNLERSMSELDQQLLNKYIKILLPVKFKNETYEYLFNFKITSLEYLNVGGQPTKKRPIKSPNGTPTNVKPAHQQETEAPKNSDIERMEKEIK